MCLPIPPLGNILVGEVGLEPTTTRVSDEYSTIELFPYGRLSIRQAYWLLRWDSNPRSSGYEPDEITTSPLSDIGWECRIRTRNLLDPNQGFYQIELTPNINNTTFVILRSKEYFTSLIYILSSVASYVCVTK